MVMRMRRESGAEAEASAAEVRRGAETTIKIKITSRRVMGRSRSECQCGFMELGLG